MYGSTTTGLLEPDGSGTTELRDRDGNGTLKTGSDNLLPLSTEDTNSRFGGDPRVIETPPLTAMHTLFLREHNRLAVEFREAVQSIRNQSEDMVYELARRTLIAQIQSVMYKNWLPPLLGPTVVKRYKLNPTFGSVYDHEVNPTISDEFAVAAFRFGHSGVRTTASMISNEGNTRKGGAKNVLLHTFISVLSKRL